MNFEDKIESVKLELDRINELDDLEQQGYEAGPLLCRMCNVTPKQLLLSVIAAPSGSPESMQRDRGLKRWCMENLPTDGMLQA